jgi:hypothetical protein
MVGKMIVTVFAGMLMIILAMQLLLCSLPLFRRLEFDAICHKYTMLMDRAGNLTPALAAQLAQELTEHRFAVTRIKGTDDADFGGILDLLVETSYPGYRFRRDLVPEEVAISFIYRSSTICRVLKNYAAVP